MSMQRTPPTSSSSTTNLITTEIIAGGSDTQLNVIAKQNLRETNTSRRAKRKLDVDYEEIISALMPQMTALFQNFEKQQSAKLETLITTITTQNTEIQNSIEFLSQKYDDCLQKMDRLEKENLSYKKKIETLESKIELMENNSRFSMIEIKNIPKQETENKETLTNIVKQIGTHLEQPILTSDIRDLYRLKTKKETSNHIIVDFTTTILKSSFIKKCRTYNLVNKNNKLNTKDIGLTCEQRPIYIDEALTKQTSKLFFLAREFVKEYKNFTCWTAYGKVYMKEKNKDNTPVIRIDNEEDLKKIHTK